MNGVFRAKNLLFAGIAVMTAYVLYHNERFLIERCRISRRGNGHSNLASMFVGVAC